MATRLPIASKFIGGFVLILLGISSFLYFFFPDNIKRTLLEKEMINAEVLIDVVSVGASLGLATADFEALSLTIKIAKEFPNAKYILLSDNSGNTIAEYNPEKLSFPEALKMEENGSLIEKDYITIKAPLNYEEELFGSLILHYSLEETNLTLKYYQKLILRLSFLILLIGATLSVGFSKIATNSIKKLIAASNRVTKGDLNSDVHISSRDEFGVLGNAFNFMLKSLRENRHIEAKNIELEEQSTKLKEQQYELEISNEELTNQREKVAQKNMLLEKSSAHLIEKAKQLEISNNFKSEFLANMSHELRSPLNSMLILANDLVENEAMNLNQDQIDSAKIIYDGGKELLTLINDILDLSKIESGKIELYLETIPVREFAQLAIKKFEHMAISKGVTLEISVDKDMPQKIKSDGQRLKQIINNLLSNAIKFTEKGEIVVKISAAGERHFSIEVKDTGIGIPENKLGMIFNAFTQADGGTTRRYGGTGLGLAITSQLCRLLSGTIEVKSTEGLGSTFIVKLPLVNQHILANEPQAEGVFPQKIEPKAKLNNKLILIIEDDHRFITVLTREVIKMGFEVISTNQGKEGLKLAKTHLPGAIVLDIGLPDISGLAVLKSLKSDPLLQTIPVHVMSVSDSSAFESLDVVQFITKPIEKDTLKKAFEKIGKPGKDTNIQVLLVEDHYPTRLALKKVLSLDGATILDTGTLKGAEEIIKKVPNLDLIVLDLKLPDGNGKELIEQLHAYGNQKSPQIIVYTGTELDQQEAADIQAWARKLIIKGAESEKKLVAEITLFLHANNTDELPDEKLTLQSQYEMFVDKTILIVDDDMRNLFALSKMLTNKGIKVIKSSSGQKALEEMEANEAIDLVLMDIMMPEMDGYECMQRIRKLTSNNSVPMIALTAKAMEGDREKCIQAGANDYMSKPIEINRLFNLMRVWITS
ncbi:MAG: signal transduction histidine kinase/CheY-like chemotaxis protein [Luteibaculaceae bacterium]|jgi:signal transduction histidine kinase/CheY-like chemotaxis protein